MNSENLQINVHTNFKMGFHWNVALCMHFNFCSLYDLSKEIKQINQAAQTD